MFSLRKRIKSLSDQQLVVLAHEASNASHRLERNFKDGTAKVEEASVCADLVEIGTVAKAVSRERVVSGNEGSHGALRNVDGVAKKLDRGWGAWLSMRRRR